MRRKKQKWSVGSLFKVPLLDGSYVIGLVLETITELYGFVGTFYNCKTNPNVDVSIQDLDLSNPDMLLLVTRDLLDNGVWTVIEDNVTNVNVKDFLDLTKLKRRGFVGVTLTGSGIVVHAFEILNHLKSNIFGDPKYLDTLLYKKKRKLGGQEW